MYKILQVTKHFFMLFIYHIFKNHIFVHDYHQYF